MNNIYLVKYNRLDSNITIFATTKKSKALKYVTKFNKILKKWKTHYSQYEENAKYGFTWIKEEHIEQYFNRWDCLHDTSKCYCEEIPLR
jgi:hypothetical protein